MKTILDKIFWPIATLIFIVLVTVFLTNNYKNALHQAKEKAAQDKLDFAASIEDVLERERTAVDRLSEISTNRQRELENEKNRANNFINGVRTGTIRVSAPVTHCTSIPPSADTTFTRPAETRAELTPEAATSLAAIASEGNQAIIGLNSCIDQYNAVRDTFNQPRPVERGNDVQAK